jgi:hypothetical protein
MIMKSTSRKKKWSLINCGCAFNQKMVFKNWDITIIFCNGILLSNFFKLLLYLRFVVFFMSFNNWFLKHTTVRRLQSPCPIEKVVILCSGILCVSKNGDDCLLVERRGRWKKKQVILWLKRTNFYARAQSHIERSMKIKHTQRSTH